MTEINLKKRWSILTAEIMIIIENVQYLDMLVKIISKLIFQIEYFVLG